MGRKLSLGGKSARIPLAGGCEQGRRVPENTEVGLLQWQLWYLVESWEEQSVGLSLWKGAV